MKESDHIIAISHTTKKDILKYTDINENKISVVYLNASSSFNNEAENRKTKNIIYMLEIEIIIKILEFFLIHYQTKILYGSILVNMFWW